MGGVTWWTVLQVVVFVLGALAIAIVIAGAELRDADEGRGFERLL